MTQRSVIHDAFSIARTYPAPVPRVFGAFTSEEAKNIWGDTGDLDSSDADGAQTEFDFRVGGRERFGFKYEGRSYWYDALYYDIVPDQRIIYSYEMYADDTRISVSVATIEFAQTNDGASLTWTEQGTYLDGIDGPGASQLRGEGTAEMLDGLGKYLASQPVT
jgi:uncharacterized protein YndB with AHSA1/START domain